MTGGMQRDTTTIGMTPKRVTVSVGVPTRYFEQSVARAAPPAAGQEPKAAQAADLESIRTEVMAKIKTHVAAILPAVEGAANAAELVTVTEFQNITPAPIPGPEMKSQVIGWLAQYWTTLGLGGLALVSMVMLRSMVRSIPPSEPHPVPPLHDSKPEEEARSDTKEAAPRSAAEAFGSRRTVASRRAFRIGDRRSRYSGEYTPHLDRERELTAP